MRDVKSNELKHNELPMKMEVNEMSDGGGVNVNHGACGVNNSQNDKAHD